MRALNSLSARQDPRSVSFDLERLFWLSHRITAREQVPEPQNDERVTTPTRAGPKTSRVLLSSRCQYLVVSLVAIGQEGSRTA